MILRRCAWHRQYHGRTKIFGVASWSGWGVLFSDGMCVDCSARTRAEWSLPPAAPPPAAVQRIRETLRPDFALATWVLVAAVAMTAGVVLGRPPARRAARPPVNVASVAGVTVPLVRERAATGPETPATATVTPTRATETTTAPRTTVPDAVRRTRPRPAPPVVHASVTPTVVEPVHAAAVTGTVVEPVRAMPVAAIATPAVDAVVAPVRVPARSAPAPRWLASRDASDQQAP